jgi:hypothetical protein
MRVIRTELYFNPKVVEALSRVQIDNPGLAVAWFAAELDTEIDLHEIADKSWHNFNLEDAEIFIAAAIANFQNLNEPSEVLIPGQIRASATANSFAKYVLEQPIVIEHSPPEAVPFSALLKGASGAVIGTYVGFQIAGENSLLLLVTVPGGLMVVSSAMGISKALEKGFNKLVSRAFKRKKS